MEDKSKYDEIFKNYLSKENSYEFLLKSQSLIKKEIKRNNKSLDFFSLISYSINHLKQYEEKESINSLLNTAIDQYIQRNPKIPQEIPPEKIIKGFIDAFSLYLNLPSSSYFKTQFISYCKRNNIEEKVLKLNKCFEIFGKESILNSQYIDAYNFCIKSDNIDLIFELYDNLEKYLRENNNKSGEEKSNNNILKNLSEEEFDILILRTTIELLMNKKIEIAYSFIGKYYKRYKSAGKNNNAVINFAYSLTCLLIREPKGFDHFWALINLYKCVVEKRNDIQFYLNKISTDYFNKPFLKTK